MVFHSQYGDQEVSIRVDKYMYNNTLAIHLICENEEDKGCPYGSLTVNLPVSDKLASDTKAFVDVNNMGKEIIAFIEDNKLGSYAGIVGSSGFCTYPLYEFDLNRLKQFS